MPISASNSRILGVWLSRLSTDRIRRAPEGPPAGSALVVSGRHGNAERLVAVDARAARLGLPVGLALAEARARHPDLAVAPEDAAADAALLQRLADWSLRYTPLIACDPPDGLLLDISGCTHLFGGEQALLDDLRHRLGGFGFAVQAAIASSIGAAWALARFGDTAILPSGEEARRLAPLPLAALRLDPDLVAALGRTGLKRIGDILDLPRAPLAARFGRDLLLQLDRALGREREPLTPRLPVAPYLAEQRFAEPVTREDALLAAVERLAGRLRPMLERRGEGARRLELSLFRTDGAVKRVAVATSRPARDARDIRLLFTERLAALADDFDPGFGFDLARLSVVAADPCAPEQIGFDGGADPGELDRLADRLAARLGTRRVTRLIAQDSHIPEAACLAIPAIACAARAGGGAVHPHEAGWTEFRRFRATAELSPRPVRLLSKPEPIEALAMVPDGPPLRFRWRRALHEVAAAEGPERIEGDWWREDVAFTPPADLPENAAGEAVRSPTATRAPGMRAYARDYFRVEDREGRRFWLFRAGLYRETATPRWFLHGLFA